MSSATLRWKRGVTAVSWPIAEQFASPLMQLVVTPVLLHRVAAPEFALWVLAQSLVVAAPIWSLGRSTALLMVVPRLPEASRAAYASRLIGQTLRLILLLALLAMSIVLVLGEQLRDVWPLVAQARWFVIGTILFLAVTEAENCIGAAVKSYRAFDESAKITPQIMQLFDRVAVLEVQQRGGANTPLSLYVDVDLELAHREAVLDEPYRSRLESGALSQEAAQALIRNQNNVVKELRMELRVHKPPRAGPVSA